MYPDHSTMNPLASIAPSSLMLSAEINHSFCLVLAVPHKTPCVVFHCNSFGNECEKGLLKMLSDFIPRAGSMHCAALLDCVQYGFLWESMDSEGRTPSFGAKGQQPGWSLSATLRPTHH